MSTGGALERFLLYFQTINRQLRKGSISESEQRLTRLQMILLRQIHKSDGITIGGLADRFGVRPSTISQMIDRLEREGLAVRHSDTSDARVKVVQLTEKGRTVLAEVESVWAMRLKSALEELSPDEQEHLVSLLGRIASSLSEDVGGQA